MFVGVVSKLKKAHLCYVHDVNIQGELTDCWHNIWQEMQFTLQTERCLAYISSRTQSTDSGSKKNNREHSNRFTENPTDTLVWSSHTKSIAMSNVNRRSFLLSIIRLHGEDLIQLVYHGLDLYPSSYLQPTTYPSNVQTTEVNTTTNMTIIWTDKPGKKWRKGWKMNTLL